LDCIHCGLLQTLGPIYTLFLAAFILKEPITLKKVLGVLVGMSGALLLIFSAYKSQDQTNTYSIWGDILVILSGVSFALYLTVFIDIIKKYSPITLMKWMFLFSSIVLIPFYFQDLKGLSTIGNLSSDKVWDFTLYLGYIILFGTFLGYILIAYAQKRIRPTIVSMYVYIQPVVMTMVSLYWGLGTLGIDKILAAILIFAGVYIVTLSKKRGNYSEMNNE